LLVLIEVSVCVKIHHTTINPR